ncbi:uracil-DNA glycosylase [Rubellimicrobium sp. CFH 75288]|uniref:uracil-DNA glycosylase n=1 Tax=Rubellimicrobium sp. CFH 75288 TaxID=2697034 RepID=UPI00141214A9|nr:uracil-DNA glycosylase [Rubellimicrobium sp. CFH 75288]NAZ37994.1 uracil-DNA glycosylase [Rubellimicrobium sp. CFH 75288]
MPSDPQRAADLAALAWLIELGADEAIGDVPVDRTALPERAPWAGALAVAATAPPASPALAPPAPAPAAPVVVPPAGAEGEAAARLAEGAGDLAALAAAMEAFDCPLRAGARRFVFADGTPGAPLMVVGEAPGREEDIEGRPFVGAAGRLLDRMLGAIGRDRAEAAPERAVYIANVLPWRPPGNRTPTPEEVARWRPFLLRHIALAAPRVMLVLGNTPAQALLGQGGITRLRGRWTEVEGRPALPSFHPSYLLRRPEAKREAWADLLEVRARLGG